MVSLCKLAVRLRLLSPLFTQKTLFKANQQLQLHKMSSTIVKSLNDKREYRHIILDNGLRALLICDPDGAEEVDMEEDALSDMESGCESAGSGSEESGDEMSGSEDEDDQEQEKKSKEGRSAAALCIGVGSFSDPADIPGFAHFLEHNSHPS